MDLTAEKKTQQKDLTTEEILDLFCPSYQIMVFEGLKIKSRTTDVTPKLAELLLKRNKTNRPISQPNVLYLAKEIEKGNWKFNGEAIKIDYNGNLINGQHRLVAITKTNRAIPLMIMSGFNPDIFSVLDTGRKRQSSDVLSIHGVDNSTIIAASIKLIFQFSNGSYGEKGGANRVLSNQDVLDFYQENPNISEIAKTGASLYKKCNKIMSPSIIVALHFLFSKKNKRDSETFFTKLCTGVDLPYGSPINALRNKLINSIDPRNRLTQTDIVSYTILAWNKFRADEKIKSLRLPDDRTFKIM